MGRAQGSTAAARQGSRRRVSGARAGEASGAGGDRLDDELDDGTQSHDGPDGGFRTRDERLAYLAGLAEGIERDDDPATGGLLTGIVDILDELSHEIVEVRREQEDLAEDMDELADELGVETSDVVVECPACGREVAFASKLLDEDDLELTCPNCGEIVYTPGEDELVDRRGMRGASAGRGEPGASAGGGLPEAPPGDVGDERGPHLPHEVR